VTDAALAMMGEPWSGMFVTLGAIDKAGHMWGAQYDAANFTGVCNSGDPLLDGPAQTHVRCAAENADVQLGKLVDAVAAKDASDGGETLVVLTADHGATYGEAFHGKTSNDASSNNWYYAPNGVNDGGSFVDPNCAAPPCLYNEPSPDLQALINTNNIQFSYQSTAIETWLTDHSVVMEKQAAAAMLQVPGVTASYWHDGDRFVLAGTNAMTKSEEKWWKKHGQEIVDTMAAPNGPDVIGLLHDKTSYGVLGDHGGAQQSVQEVPVVFWSPSLAFAENTGATFRTPDILPTILRAMGIPITTPMDGVAHSLT
jgi:arylsulfatase A-like enzyme